MPGEPNNSGAARLVHAIDHLGIEVIKRKGNALTARVNNAKLTLDLGTLAAQLTWLGNDAPPESVAVALAATLNLKVPPALTRDLREVAPLLRPVLVRPEELQGPMRSMCRRDAFGPLLLAVAFGVAPNAPRVQTVHLDQWDAEFDDVIAVALHNLENALDPDDVLGVEATKGLLAVMSDDEPASAACFIFPHLIPDLDPHAGVLFGVPNRNTTIAIPVIPGDGAEAFASLVEMMFSLAGRQSQPLSDQVFWWREGAIEHIPMVEVEERGKRRIHLDARGTVADLLDVLGEIEDDEDDEDNDSIDDTDELGLA